MFSCFTNKEFLRRFLKISMPVMISAFISFLVSFLDNVMVGTVSNEAVSGVYAANEVTYLVNLAGSGILEGAGIFNEQFTGANDTEDTKQCFCYKCIVALLFLLIVMPVVYFFGQYLIYLFCYRDSNYLKILEEGKNYLYIVALSYIPFMIGYVYSTSLREIGKTKHAMISSMVAVVANVFFNFIFIIVLKQGAIGAAIATIIARVLEMFYLIFISSINKFSFCDKAFKNFKIEKELFKKITSKGWLLFINEIGFSVGTVMQSLAFSQRDGVLSSISIVTTISNIFMILINGLSVGIGVMVGSSLGSSDFEKAKSDNKNINLLGFYTSVFIGLILISLSYVLPKLFTEVTDEQKLLATKLIIIYGSLLWANCLSLTSYYTLRVGGKTLLTFLLDSGTMLVFYVPLSWILAMATRLDMIYIYLIIRSLDVLKASLGIYLMKRGSWVNNLTLINQNA